MIRITNGKIVTADAVEAGRDLIVHEERIAATVPEGDTVGYMDTIDAGRGYIIPGLVDFHSDTLEYRLRPQPDLSVPADLGLPAYEKELLASGITTQFHGISWGAGRASHWDPGATVELIGKLLDYRDRGVITHKIAIRFNIDGCHAMNELLGLIREGSVDLLSLEGGSGRPGEPIPLLDIRDRTRINELERVAVEAQKHGVPLASHNDDTLKHMTLMSELGVTVAQFPTNPEMARAARARGMYTTIGAPDVVRDAPSGTGVTARTLVWQRVVDVMCSGYYPMSLLHAAFILYAQEMVSLPEAVRMATTNAAKAARLKDDSVIKPGGPANLVIVTMEDAVPEVRTVFVCGRKVYSYEGEYDWDWARCADGKRTLAGT
jgi:alpha-D-ribose 1-methylphosphonate 5-triphosphate diphosphatase